MNAKILLLASLLVALMFSSCAPAPAEVPTPTQLPATSTPVPPTVTPTATSLPPAVFVSEPVECKGGPGEGYTVIATLEPGEPARLVGQDALGEYWILLETRGQKGCWLQRQNAVIEGDASGLPVLIPGPTQRVTPNAPANFKATASCIKKPRSSRTNAPYSYKTDVYEIAITLSWEDKSENETGFELQRNRAPYKSLDPNTTTINDSLTFNDPVSGAVLYWLRAVNENGRSTRVEVMATYRCQ